MGVDLKFTRTSTKYPYIKHNTTIIAKDETLSDIPEGDPVHAIAWIRNDGDTGGYATLQIYNKTDNRYEGSGSSKVWIGAGEEYQKSCSMIAPDHNVDIELQAIYEEATDKRWIHDRESPFHLEVLPQKLRYEKVKKAEILWDVSFTGFWQVSVIDSTPVLVPQYELAEGNDFIVQLAIKNVGDVACTCYAGCYHNNTALIDEEVDLDPGEVKTYKSDTLKMPGSNYKVTLKAGHKEGTSLIIDDTRDMWLYLPGNAPCNPRFTASLSTRLAWLTDGPGTPHEYQYADFYSPTTRKEVDKLDRAVIVDQLNLINLGAAGTAVLQVFERFHNKALYWKEDPVGKDEAFEYLPSFRLSDHFSEPGDFDIELIARKKVGLSYVKTDSLGIFKISVAGGKANMQIVSSPYLQPSRVPPGGSFAIKGITIKNKGMAVDIPHFKVIVNGDVLQDNDADFELGPEQEKEVYFENLSAPSSVGSYTVKLKVWGKNTESEPS